ncbi:MAG: hypothetical protein FJ320_08060 [SAR202 cluster bacterium]|nr:hypothetical protein [SAR202 cluster bacterium]
MRLRIGRIHLAGLSLDWLVLASQVCILDGSEGVPQDILSAASKEILRRIRDAGEFDITPREVLLSFLKPALATQGHCRCPSCRARCAVCRAVHQPPRQQRAGREQLGNAEL